MESYASSAQLPSSESLAQLLIKMLCEGLHVLVTVEEKTYDGVVCNIDASPGYGDHVFADVHVPGLDCEADDNFWSVKVSIHTDGTVNVMSATPSEAPPAG